MSLVEYHDPDGLFPLISPQLQRLLPLRNLHWKSNSRPLRSIPSLRVDFVSSSPAKLTLEKNSSETNHPPQPVVTTQRGRRHQLPGLRPTPYLRIYLLRCDDRESYKSVHRRALREWLGENIISSQTHLPSHKADNHDACEWLILHVVLPNTAVATEQRGKIGRSDGEALGDKISSNSRWPGRPPRTLLEKLKSDFNQSGKSSLDRVTQVRLTQDAQPPDYMPSSANAPATISDDGVQEQENTWNDLIVKLKTLILLSFDLRVAQYEDDIREKDAQRVLPGWNFCTFFVLKEGLAGAFESVGLVEDALACYDELSAGLDLFLDQNNTSGVRGPSDALLAHTDDLQNVLLRMLGVRDRSINEQMCVSRFNHPFNTSHKPYREMVASNNISLLDFRCYLFARQLELYPRLIWPSHAVRTSTEETNQFSPPTKVDLNKEVENSGYLADLGQLAAKMMHSLAHLLRSDLWGGYITGNSEKESQLTTSSAKHFDESQTRVAKAIDIIVDVWSYSATKQLLQETNSTQFSTLRPSTMSGSEGGEDRLSALGISFQPSSGKLGSAVAEPSTLFRTARPFSNDRLATAAAQIAELCLRQRRILERIGNQGGVPCGVMTNTMSSAPWVDNAEKDHDATLECKHLSLDDTCLSLLPRFKDLELASVLGTTESARRRCSVRRKDLSGVRLAYRHF